MKVLPQIAIILAVCLTGELISSLLPFVFPASVLSMILLFVLLSVKFLKTSQIDGFATFFQKNMAFFFIPSGVGILEYFSLLQEKFVVLLVICVVSTVLTFAATAFTVTMLMRLQERRKEKRG